MSPTLPAPPLRYRFRVTAAHGLWGSVTVISEAIGRERSALLRAYAFAAHLRSRGWTVLTNQTEVAE